MAITDKIYIKNHRQLVSQLETSFPKSAFDDENTSFRALLNFDAAKIVRLTRIQADS